MLSCIVQTIMRKKSLYIFSAGTGCFQVLLIYRYRELAVFHSIFHIGSNSLLVRLIAYPSVRPLETRPGLIYLDTLGHSLCV
jgi:hypothetical protein